MMPRPVLDDGLPADADVRDSLDELTDGRTCGQSRRRARVGGLQGAAITDVRPEVDRYGSSRLHVMTLRICTCVRRQVLVENDDTRRRGRPSVNAPRTRSSQRTKSQRPAIADHRIHVPLPRGSAFGWRRQRLALTYRCAGRSNSDHATMLLDETALAFGGRRNAHRPACVARIRADSIDDEVGGCRRWCQAFFE